MADISRLFQIVFLVEAADALGSIQKFTDSLVRTGSVADALKENSAALGAGLGLVGAGFVSVASSAIWAASELEDTMVQVDFAVQNVGGSVDGLANQFMGLGKAPEPLLRAAEMAAQSGRVGAAGLEDFALKASIFGKVSGQSTEAAAKGMTTLMSSMSLTTQEAFNLSSAMVAMNREFGVSYGSMQMLMQQVGPMVQDVEGGVPVVLGMAAAMEKLGIRANRATQPLLQFVQFLDPANEKSEDLNDTLAELTGSARDWTKVGADQKTLAFMQALKKLPQEEALDYMKEFGFSNKKMAMQLLKTPLDQFSKQMKTVADEMLNAKAINEEYAQTQATLASRWAGLQTGLSVIGKRIGMVLLPLFSSLVAVMLKVIKVINGILALPVVGTFLSGVLALGVGILGVVGAMLIAIKAGSMLYGAWANLFGPKGLVAEAYLWIKMIHPTLGPFFAKFEAGATAFRNFGMAALRSLGWIVLLAAAIYLIYEAVQKAVAMYRTGEGRMRAFAVAIILALGPIAWVIAAFIRFQSTLDGVKKWLRSTWQEFTNFLGPFAPLANAIKGVVVELAPLIALIAALPIGFITTGLTISMVSKSITSSLEAFNALGVAFPSLGKGFGLLKGKIAGLIPWLGGLATAAWAAIVPFLPIIAIVAAVVAAIALLYFAIKYGIEMFTEGTGWTKVFGAALLMLTGPIGIAVLAFLILRDHLGDIFGFFGKMWRGVVDGMKWMARSILAVGAIIWNAITSPFVWAYDTVVAVWQGIVSIVKWAWDSIVSIGQGIIDGILAPFRWLGKAADWLKTKLFGSGFLGLDVGIAEVRPPLKEFTHQMKGLGAVADTTGDKSRELMDYYSGLEAPVYASPTSVEASPLATPEMRSRMATTPATTVAASRVEAPAASSSAVASVQAGGTAASAPATGAKTMKVSIPVTLNLDGFILARVLSEHMIELSGDRFMNEPLSPMRGIGG